MKKTNLSILLLLMLFGNCAIPLMAQPGTLDNTFGTGGKVMTSADPDDMYGESVLIQPDGKIIVAGATYGGNYDFAVVRYNSNGTLDNTFSGDGKVTTDFSTYDDYVLAAALQPDGKIVVGGFADSGVTTNIGIARYTSTGIPDSTFSGDGKAIIRVFLNTGLERLDDIIVQPDGKIVAVGYAGDDIVIIRLNSNGSYDMNFNSKGWITIDIDGNFDAANSVALQSDGKIVAAGYGKVSGTDEIAIVRLKTDGTLDNTFSSDGKTTVKVANGASFAGGIAIQTNGKIVIAGSSMAGGSEFQCAVIRLNDDGTPDNSFSGDGQLNHSILSSQDYFSNLIIQPDGKILAVGTVQDSANTYFALVRYKSDGSFDTSFNSTGITTLSFGSSVSLGTAVALQSNNRIIVAGSAQDSANLFSIALAGYIPGIVTTAVKEHLITDSKLYPNPANDYLYLEYKLSVSGSVSIQLIDMMGRTVLMVADNKTMEAGIQTETIDLQSLSKGIYTLIVRTQNTEQSYLVVH